MRGFQLFAWKRHMLLLIICIQLLVYILVKFDTRNRLNSVLFNVLFSSENKNGSLRKSEYPNGIWQNKEFYFLPTLQQRDYTVSVEGQTCLKEGTDLNGGRIKEKGTSQVCSCKDGWHGTFCSIPTVVFHSDTPWKKSSLTLRQNPRRIIQAFPFNVEFDLLEIRLAESYDVVDVFLIVESNYTFFGERKELQLLDRLKTGEYQKYANKIVHLFVDFFPKGGREDGWIVETVNRNYMGTHGMQKVKNWTMDDLFFMTDADEIPSRKALLFLKLHDGYTEPISYAAWYTIYGFFWSPYFWGPYQHLDKSTGKPRVQSRLGCVTMGMLVHVFRYQPNDIRDMARFLGKHSSEVNLYKTMGGKIGMWEIGKEGMGDGWHCSYCFHPEGIRVKLISTQCCDFGPRWANFPDKVNITYLRSVVARGMWFDEKQQLTRVNISRFGPEYLLANQKKYWHLIHNLYAGTTVGQSRSTIGRGG